MEDRMPHILLYRLRQSKSFAAAPKALEITYGVCPEALLQK